MAERITNTNGHFEFEALSEGEGFSLFDKAVKYYLDISGQEFLNRLEDGDFEDTEDPEVSEVLTLLPFARA